MSAEAIERIAAQEAALVFASFNEEVALAIGTAVRAAAAAEGHAIVVDVRFWDRQLFFSAMAGTSADNAEWVRRKINMVRRFHKSSYRLALEYRAAGKAISRDNGLDPMDYCLAGGSVPIRLAGVGPVGTVTVSGVPEWIDHALVIEAMAGHLGLALGERVNGSL